MAEEMKELMRQGALVHYQKWQGLFANCGELPDSEALSSLCNRFLKSPLRVGKAADLAVQGGRQRNPHWRGLRGYLARIIEKTEIPTRDQNLHDFLNLLTWLEFPRLKWEISDLSYKALQASPQSLRPRLVDALTIFDESAVIYIVDELHLERVLSIVQSRDEQNKRSLLHDGRLLVFGHGLMEHLLHKISRVYAMTLVVTPKEFEQLLSDGQVFDWPSFLPSERLGSLPIDRQTILCPAWQPRARYETAPMSRPF